jgi:serine/threonine protein kinase
LKHPNIVLFLGVHVTPKREYYLVTEYFAKGDLVNVLRREGPKFKLTDLINMYGDACHQVDKLFRAVGAAEGVNYLHQNGIIHRDLACRNLLGT